MTVTEDRVFVVTTLMVRPEGASADAEGEIGRADSTGQSSGVPSECSFLDVDLVTPGGER